MINKLCKMCVKTCKQSDATHIVSCPKFRKKPSDEEFRGIVNELDTIEETAKKIQKNVRNLTAEALSGKTHESQPESEEKSEL